MILVLAADVFDQNRIARDTLEVFICRSDLRRREWDECATAFVAIHFATLRSLLGSSALKCAAHSSSDISEIDFVSLRDCALGPEPTTNSEVYLELGRLKDGSGDTCDTGGVTVCDTGGGVNLTPGMEYRFVP